MTSECVYIEQEQGEIERETKVYYVRIGCNGRSKGSFMLRKKGVILQCFAQLNDGEKLLICLNF